MELRTLTVMIIYGDSVGGDLRSAKEVEVLLERAANIVGFWKRMAQMPDVTALRDENGVLAGTITKT